MNSTHSIFTLANFNLQNFNAALKKELPGVQVEAVEYEQMFPFLLHLKPGEKKDQSCICWLSLGDVLKANAMKLDLVDLVLNLKQCFQFSMVILPSVDSPAFNMFQGHELRQQLFKLQLDLTEKAEGSNIVLLNPTPWLIQQGANAVSSQLWYLTKTPFHKNVFKAAAETCHHVLNAVSGKSKKVLIVDLDDTIWGGIVGDDGIENLKIGGHDPVGEAFADFQRWIKYIQSWGVILCICSKNDEKIVWEAFEKHSGMVLKKEDFVKWKINWEDKAANIVDLVHELNVGMDSVVFLDDNPVERNRIRTALPAITVPEMPEDKMEYPAFIRSLAYFDRKNITEEDKKRTELYQEENSRKQTQQAFASMEEWIKSLNIRVEFEELNEVNLIRAEQLLNKTNQMNLRTRRMTKDELRSWAEQKDHWLYAVHVKDIFGDNGITGLIGFHKTDQNTIFVDDFVMSCRVMGRKIEDQMLAFVQQKTREQNLQLVVEYLPTEKNKPMRNFLNSYENTGDHLHITL